MSAARGWPALPLTEWAPTRDTLHLLTQIVGKVRLARTPVAEHWWNVPLYVTARGLTSSLMPAGPRAFQIDFDFIEHVLRVTASDGERWQLPLAARPVAETYDALMAGLDGLGLATDVWPMPVEIEGAIRFDEDHTHTAYDPVYAAHYWHALVSIQRLFELFRAEFLGKMSPVHLWWGALDLAVSRFSGRPAPPHPGRAPNCGRHVMLEAYSREVSSAGFWPGPDGEGTFYSYVYPEPAGFRDRAVRPGAARFDEELGEFVLPYEVVRTAADPDEMLLEFLHSTYAAAAETGGWNRTELER